MGGIGYGRERDAHIDDVRNYASWYGGIGVRVRMTDRTFAAPECRLGDDDARAIVGVG